MGENGMRIREIMVSKTFKYLWLKTVEGVDLSQHCARCLAGEYSKAVSNTTERAENITLGDSVYYLCGVALPFNWHHNFHLAFRPRLGSEVELKSNGIHVVIEDAERLPVSAEYIDPDDPHANTKAYNTCRNWQFAHYYKKRLMH